MVKNRILLVISMLILAVAVSGSYQVSAAKKTKLSSKKMSINVGSKKKIKLKNKKKNKKYIFSSSRKKVASVSKKGVVTAKKRGKAVISVKEQNKSGGKKKLVGKVKVKVKKDDLPTNVTPPAVTPVPGQSEPIVTPEPVIEADVYVSPDGNDNGDGSKNSPFRTLVKAKEAVASMDKSDDIIVELADGFYPVQETIQFTSADSGNENCTITYRAAEGATPIISGGIKIEDEWEEATEINWLSGGRTAYKVPLEREGKLRSIYVNEERAAMTQKKIWGAGGFGSYSINKDQASWAWNSRYNMNEGTLFGSGSIDLNTRNAHNIEMESSSRWAKQSVCIDRLQDNGNGQIRAYYQMPYGAFAQNLGWGTAFNPDGEITVVNVYEWLNNPGEFYFDEEGQMLYYIPRDGEDMSTAEVVVPWVETILDMTGDDPLYDYVQNIVFDGIEFAYSDYKLQEVDGSYGYASVQGAIVLKAFGLENQHDDIYRTYDIPISAVHLSSTRNVKFLNGAVRHTGSVGMHVENDVMDIDITGNYFGKTSGAGIVIGHPTHVYENDGPEHHVTGANNSAGPDKEKFPEGTEGVPTNISLTNNYFLENCYFFSSHSPITSFYTYNLQVLHNFVYKCSYSGMSIGWGWCNFDGYNGSDSQLPGIPTTTSKNNHVNYNRVEEICSLLQDAGCIYTLGQQGNDDWTEYSEMSYNYLNAKREPQVADGSRMVNGFHPDEGSAYIKFDSNVITNTIRNVYELNDWRRKHDMIVTNGFSNTDRSECTAPNCTLDQYVNADYIWPLKGYETVLYSGLEDEYVHMVGQDVIPDTDYELASNVRLSAGQELPRRGLLAEDDTVWLAPEGTTSFAEGSNMTCAAGNEKSMVIPEDPGQYKLYIVYSDGYVSDASTFTLHVGEANNAANVSDGGNYSVSKLRPLVLELDESKYSYRLNNESVGNGHSIDTDGRWTLVATPNGGGQAVTMLFTTSVTLANKLLESDVTVSSGGEIYFDNPIYDGEKTIWLGPSGLSAFADGDPTMSRTSGNSTSMNAPTQPGKYILTVVNSKNDIVCQSDAFVTVE